MSIKRSPFIPVILLLMSSQASADQYLTFGARLLGAGWKGDASASNAAFESDKGGQFGLNVAYRNYKFYTGLNLQKGEYQFDGNAPDKFTKAMRVPSSNVTIEQSDFDLLVGYYFWDKVSLFADIKAVTNDWLNESYSQTFVGLGLGVSGYLPMNERWTLFGSFGFIGNGEINDNDDKKVGEGNSWALEGGVVYSLNPSNHFNVGIKTRRYDFEYLDSTTQEYSINALFVGYSYNLKL